MQAKGKLDLQVDDSGMEAALVFVPDDERGSLWNKPKIANFLEEKGIVTGISEEALDGALAEFSEAEEKVRKVVAEGTPPEQSETFYHWEECPVPEELSAEAERILTTAPPPEITRSRSSREKVKKKVSKKSNLPFVKPKQEVVEQWETKKWEEPVEVDPTVVDSGWVDEGQLIAKKEQGQEERSGLSVYGTRVRPSGEEKEEFFPGRGLREDREALYALYSGFLRRGEHWAEVIPFSRHRWELTESKDRATCYLSFQPGEEAAPVPGAEHILEAARQRGFTQEELLPTDEVERLIRSALKSGEEIREEPLTLARDGWYEITVSEDKLKATLSMEKGSARGKALPLKEVAREIKKRGFKGLDFEKVKSDLLEFYRSEGRELHDYLLAEGTAPEKAPDRSIEFTCEFLPEEEMERLLEAAKKQVTAEEYPSLKVYPLKEVQKMAWVKQETVFAELSTREQAASGEDVFGRPLEGKPGNDPDLDMHEHVGLKNDFLYAETEGILDKGEAEGEIKLRVRRHRDAAVTVTLSKDAMQAFLTLQEAEGSGEPLTLERVSAALEQRGVVKGINSAAVSNALEKARGGEEVEGFKVAEGIPPIDPGRSRLKFAVRRASGKSYTIKENGKADYKQQDHITTVEKDQLIARIVSSDTKPRDGWDVLGNKKPAKDPPPLSLEIGENIRQEEGETGGTKLYAQENGELYYDQKRIRVHTVHTVQNDVDLHTGNINFPGEVQVGGNVTRGFYVMAGSDVKIAGNIEGALVSSGGSVTVKQGIVGGNKAVVRAKKDIRTTFAEQATLLAVGDLKVKNSCLRCDIKCNGTLQLVSPKGELVGGETQTRRGLAAQQLGNEKHVTTRISFGQDYLVFDQIQKQEKEIGKLKENITQLDNQMRDYEKRGQRKALDNARNEKLKLMKLIEKRSMHLFSLRERYEEHFESRIEVRGKVYPGVIFESHGRFLEISSVKQKVAFTFDEEKGRIVEQEIKEE